MLPSALEANGSRERAEVGGASGWISLLTVSYPGRVFNWSNRFHLHFKRSDAAGE